MKKKISAVLFAISLFLTFAPITANAECEHQWGEWKEVTEPSCLRDGREERICKECLEEEERPVPAIGHHTWREWVIEEEPTCEFTGSKTRTCTVCDMDEDQDIPKTQDHSWGKWKTTKKATALSNGKESRFCFECDKEETKSIPKLKAKVSLKERTATIESGKSHTIKIKSKTYGDKVEKWTSSNEKIATITSGGKVTGKQAGTVTVTLKMKSGAKATCKINVTKAQQSVGSHSSNSGSTSTSSGSGSHSSGNNVTAPSSGYVWIPNSGSKYHKSSTCSGMRNPRQVTVDEAVNRGYEPCSRCY